jgi:hypothetical protein
MHQWHYEKQLVEINLNPRGNTVAGRGTSMLHQLDVADVSTFV